jgi:hypothetical protein
VWLTTLLPEPGELEDLLRLEAAVRRKILAASVYGMESGVIDDVEPELRAYAERLAGGDETLLDEAGDDGAGTFAGESLRAELMRAIGEGELNRLRSLPWGIGAGFRQAAGSLRSEHLAGSSPAGPAVDSATGATSKPTPA